jgi:hypothetical protein
LESGHTEELEQVVSQLQLAQSYTDGISDVDLVEASIPIAASL